MQLDLGLPPPKLRLVFTHSRKRQRPLSAQVTGRVPLQESKDRNIFIEKHCLRIGGNVKEEKKRKKNVKGEGEMRQRPCEV